MLKGARFGLGVVAVCSGMLLLGCASGDGVQSDSTISIATDLPLVGTAWFRQAPFALSAEFEKRLFDANQVLLRKCLGDKGFDYIEIPFPEAMLTQDLVSPLDRKFAESHGYHRTSVTLQDPNTELYQNQAFGTAYDECGRKANDATLRLTDDLAEQSLNATNQLRKTFATFGASDQGSTVTLAWSACMGEKGYNFGSPVEPARLYSDEPDITAEEIKIRLADLDCDLAAGYTDARFGWESTQVQSWLDGHEGVVRELNDAIQEVEKELIDVEAAIA